MKPNTRAWAILTRAFTRTFRQVIRDVVGKLEESGAFAIPAVPPEMPLDAWQDAWWEAAVNKHLEAPLLRLIEEQVRITLDGLGAAITNEIQNAYVTAVAAQHVRQIVSWAPEIGKHIFEQVSTGILQGESIPKISKRLQETVGGTERATLIARTETIAATNGANMAAYRISGVELRKEWLATGDARTRDTHRAASGQLVERDAPFTVGGYPADYPGDPNLPASERVNCRCAVLPVRGSSE